ncbi:alanine--glyoxylate aminotransferase family protein [Pusillimonas caeni]|uniref:aminotransferase class V-fold PLP-dependent enzyme n=1 Tax=Pusillimonas caeni TaxID=1348472 RepID=UPI000E599F31|nr:aminotransferase class V-fold PLP-dependent enzyme [Pusillimonas caeni]TFL14504.1 alanine--glyoxylate aminotransferase family protein [Pusillimonas caeni]
MPGLLPDVDPDGLLEYSVVYTDRALNHMSNVFQGVMKDISRTLKQVYGAQAAIVVPGSGTFGMEAVARQFATGKRCLVIRNGWFSYRWTQIFEAGSIPAEEIVLKARPIEAGAQAPFQPPPIEEVVQAIARDKPDLVFAAHVETASGILLPDDYLRQVGEAARAAGALFVLDCIASGTVWVDMGEAGVDVLITAPQKGWTGSACCGLVMLGERALERIGETTSTSFACDLRKWLQIMQAYEQGGFAYHATMPTDSLAVLRDAMAEAQAEGFEALRRAQFELGTRVRALLREKGFKSVAAPGFEAPGVVVSYTDDDGIQSARKFAQAGIQAAAGVPLQCDEPPGFKTFRLGLFGLDKLRNVDRSVDNLARVLDQIVAA